MKLRRLVTMSKPPPDPLFIFRAHKGSVSALHFVNQKEVIPELSHIPQPCLLSGSDIGEIFLWNLKTYRVYCKLCGHEGKAILWLNFFDKYILSQERAGSVGMWNYIDDSWVIYRTFSAAQVGFCSSSHFINEGNLYIAAPGCENSSISVIDTNSSQAVLTIQPKDESSGMCMCIKVFTMNNKTYILCGYENGKIMLYDCWNKLVVSELLCHKEPVMCLDFDSMHRQQGITGSAEADLVVWTVNDSLELTEKKRIHVTNVGISCISIRPDGKIVATGGWDSCIRVFSWKTLKPLAVLSFHTGTIHCLTFSCGPVGKHHSVCAAGSKDQNISLWALY